MPDELYGTRPLPEKLGLQKGGKAAVVGPVPRELSPLLRRAGVSVVGAANRKNLDMVFVGAESRSDLDALTAARRWIREDGAIWVLRRKGSPEIRESDVIASAKWSDLVDNKVVRFSATHAAERLVVPKASRSKR